MERTKDNAALALSMLAFVLSLFATVLGEMRAHEDKQRQVRSQLTEVLRSMTSLYIDRAKLLRESRDDPEYRRAGSEALGQQNGFLLDQAFYLADQVPDLVTTYEYNTIATGSANAGDTLAAEKYHLRAVEVAHSPMYKAQAIRSYAAYLFTQRRFVEGREQFNRSLSLLRETSNLSRQVNGMTYQLWALCEKSMALAAQDAMSLYEKARLEYAGIDVIALREMLLAGLAWERDQAPGEPTVQNATAQAQAPTSLIKGP